MSISPDPTAGDLAVHQEVPTSEAQRRGLLFGVFAPPLAWLGQLQATYALVPWTCATGQRSVLLFAHGASFVVCVLGAWSAWRSWPSDQRWAGEPHRLEGARILSLLGVALGTAFAVAVIAAAIPTFVLRPCD